METNTSCSAVYFLIIRCCICIQVSIGAAEGEVYKRQGTFTLITVNDAVDNITAYKNHYVHACSQMTVGDIIFVVINEQD